MKRVVEADKEKAAQVKAKEIMRTDDHVISSKPTDHLSQDSWVRVKYGTYKGDLAKVMYVDNARQKVRVKLIPRIDLQALADKLHGKQVEKDKDKSRPQQRLMDSYEALERKIQIGFRKDPKGGCDFWYIDGMLFRFGFLHKTVPIKSISTQSIQPSHDELVNFQEPIDKEEEITPLSDAIYFSDLSEKQVMELFCKFPKGPNCSGGVFGSNIIKGKYGSIELTHVALKYAVDAVLEVELDVPSKEITFTRVKMWAYYGSNLKLVDGKPCYQGIIVDTEHVKPGKIKLMRNRFAVPATSWLVIHTAVNDVSGFIFSGYYGFHVPLNGGSSVGLIGEERCSFKLKMDWKLPDDIRSLCAGC